MARVSLVSVVTINLGGLMGLSKGLATRRERDLVGAIVTPQSRLPPIPSQETTVIPGVEGTRPARGPPRPDADPLTLRRRIPPDRGGPGDGLRCGKDAGD